jgi:hypothetical protein
MESSTPTRVLVVAHKTAATQALMQAVRDRAARGPATFTLVVPSAAHGLHRLVDPEDQDRSEAELVLDLALPLLEEAAGRKVEGMIGDPNPLNAVQDAVNLHGFDAPGPHLALDAPGPPEQADRPRPPGDDRDRAGPHAGACIAPRRWGHAAGTRASRSLSACVVDQNAMSSHGSCSGVKARTSVASGVVCGSPIATAS